MKYFESGDYSTFKRICDIAIGEQNCRTQHFYFNFFTACQIAGLIEVSETERNIRWTVAFVKNVVINSDKPKTIGTSLDWFMTNASQIKPLIIDSNKRALLLGIQSVTDSDSTSGLFLERNFWQVMPSFRDAESEVCFQEAFPVRLGHLLQKYQPETASWYSIDDNFSGSGLLRTRTEFSGYSYFVSNASCRLLFRITQAEWAFISASQILNWSINDFIRVHHNNLDIPRSVRLPTLLLRFLFSTSSKTQVGASVTFSDIEPSAFVDVTKYLNPMERSYAS